MNVPVQLAQAVDAVDWQHVGGAGFIGICFLFAPFVTEILKAWWNRKRGEVDWNQKTVQAIDRVSSRLDDISARLREHAESDLHDTREVSDAVDEARSQLQRIEVELARRSH